MKIEIKSIKISLPWWLVLLIAFVAILALRTNPSAALEIIKEWIKK